MNSAAADPAIIEMREASISTLRDASLTVVNNVNWSVAPGEFWVIAGQQQSGKSDFLMTAAGLLLPASGSCRVFGRETDSFAEAELAERLRIGYVFAGGKLFSQLTVAENVALPLRYQQNLSTAEASAAVAELLEVMELTPFADTTPSNLAANWRQRAALARALILKPEVLLLDNPLSGLGARHLQWWLRFLDQLSRGHGQLGGRAITLVATADDLRPWQNARRKFALLRDKKFIPLGSWNEIETANDPIVKELLAAQVETTI